MTFKIKKIHIGRSISIVAAVVILLLGGCTNSGFWTGKSPLFRLLDKDETGLDFENVLRATSEFNVFNYEYFFNGGGVAAGDFNNDGLTDLFFTANMGPNKLFLNEGELHFKDATEEAGVAGLEGWTAGAAVVDINNDGLLDIYVSQMGDYQTIKGKNQLWVCQQIVNGVPVFMDKARHYGLDLVGFSTQATFFDYDLDGDLDMYQLNHSLHANSTFGPRAHFEQTKHPLAGDKLLRNDGGQFIEVSQKAGINSAVIGYGRGISVADVNLDGWPDIYIANDFHENDYLYLNQGDGTFKEVLTEQLKHTSRFSTGVDMADINNDGFCEILTTDHLPEDPFVLKTTLGEEDINLFKYKLDNGYNHQYARNNLQLNNADNTFSEIGLLANVAASDWSWSPLLVDFDFDGFKDVFISNGINRQTNDIDYVNYRANNEVRWISNTNNLVEEDLVVVEEMPKNKQYNKFFKNTGQLHFEDVGSQIINAQLSYSNGAAYADLDNDGDIDMVVNNIEEEPFIYENLTIEDDTNTGGDYLHLSLIGSPNNRQAIGTTIIVYKGTEKITYQHFPQRGYQSSMGQAINLGVGEGSAIDSVLIIWPLRTYKKLKSPTFNEKITLSWQSNLPVFDYNRLHETAEESFAFWDLSNESGISFNHQEDDFVDFNTQSLIPHLASVDGPAVAVGDANGDGLADVFLGNALGSQSRLFMQLENGAFEDQTPAVFQQDSLYEDVDAVWVDIDNDEDQDLIVVGGANKMNLEDSTHLARVYLNDGLGNLERDTSRFGQHYTVAARIVAADVNEDGWIDVFIGGRMLPSTYGLTPSSYLFINQGDGHFVDVTAEQAPGLSKVGLVRDVHWADMDLDGDQDLVLALEWNTIQVFFNENGFFEGGPINDLSGWWNFLLPYDFDQDGDIDIIAGNLGENTKLKATKEMPIKLYINDFDDNGEQEQILTYFVKEQEIPFANFAELSQQLSSIKEKYPLAADFARASLDDLFDEDKLEAATQLSINTTRSMYFENTGQQGLQYIAHTLPDQCQFSTLNAAMPIDLNGDERVEVIVGGNFYGTNIEMGRYDASYGQVLTFDQNVWKALPLAEVHLTGQIRQIVNVQAGGKPCILVAKNNEHLQVIKPQE